ncbi:MAG: MoaD/ThiS family protein [Candidatus Hodarchaeota archaeon]
MIIQLKLFGDLRRKVKPEISGTAPLRFNITDSEIKLITDILEKLNIEEKDVSHIFVNGSFSGLMKEVKNGDTVALFPRNMGLLYKWYFKREGDE